MARFERLRERSTPRKGGRSKGNFEGNRKSGRNFSRSNRDGRNFEMTKVICSDCKKECEVPFKPTSSKPVYCSDCFKTKRGSTSGPNRSSNSDLDMINEKLNKIMIALKIK